MEAAMSEQASEAWRLLRRARDLEQQADGLKHRAARLLRAELLNAGTGPHARAGEESAAPGREPRHGSGRATVLT